MSLHGTSANGVRRILSAPNYNGDYTVAFVFKPTTLPANDRRYVVAINGTDESSLNDVDAMRLTIDANSLGSVGLYSAIDGNLILDTVGAVTVSSGTFYWGALQRSGTSLRAYIGTSPSTLALAHSDTADIASRTRPAASLLFGDASPPLNNEPIDADWSAARAFERALSLGEIQARMAYWPSSKLDADAWGAWRLQSAQDYNDYSGNNRHLSVLGSVTTAADPAGLGSPVMPTGSHGWLLQHIHPLGLTA